ncbi:MAG: RNA polymerase factor sigma-54 [Gammaproteobacteria bacterium]
MKQSLQLRLGQHLTMTPQLQQAIRLLQLSTLELQTEVQQALDSNLMLEEAAEEEHAGGGANGEADAKNTEADVQPVDIPEQLPVDSAWEDIYDAAPSLGTAPDDSGPEIEGQRTGAESLKDHLYWQLGLSYLSDTDKLIAALLIDAIDDDGYLRVPLEDIQHSVAHNGTEVAEIAIEEIEAVLHHVQHLDPTGVGARDLRECLLLQLQQEPIDSPWRDAAIRLVDVFLDVLAARDYAQLARRMQLTKEELQQVIALVQTLNPRPGGQIHPEPVQYVVPDVFVRKHKATWMVELNPDAIPRLRINSYYASLIRRADNSADNNCLKTHLQEARWFLKSLKSRSETLLKVATCIVERQQAFLEYGEEGMKPMVLHDVAEVVGMHESTISRVTTQKYMHTPRGIFELKYFFSSHVSTQGGGEASSTAIRALIKKLIAAENPRKPLSDSKLASILSEQGINVARRTVAKYREGMTIPSSNERKRLV